MRFINYSDWPLKEIPSFQHDGTDHRGTKPNGIWFSVFDEYGRDSWKEHCEGRQISLKPYRTELLISEDAKILQLTTVKDIDRFTNQYSYFRECPKFLKSNPDYTRSSIHWDKVAEQHDGIIITPFCEARYQQQLWYFTWGCSSGCIWDKEAVKELRPSSA